MSISFLVSSWKERLSANSRILIAGSTQVLVAREIHPTPLAQRINMSFRSTQMFAILTLSVFGICGQADSQETGEGHQDGKHMHTNQLIDETSPYLLQHAHNPVNWHPWGAKAFELAKKQNKPIFLSVGYSTCYWCHVMERESFERGDVAAILNQHYIAIKVDREERPELDQQFMVATQVIARGRGGWPNSVWLTSEGKPWMAGTYFPREQFKQVLVQMADAWKTKHDIIMRQAESITDLIEQYASAEAETKPVTAPLLQATVEAAASQFDSKRGGFGTAPKFPPHDMLAVLIDQYRRTQSKPILEMIDTTLRDMARGGVYDQIGGGFHRYSTDANWLLPHFEKMLYDNGQLIRFYTDGYLLTDDDLYRETVEGIYQWLDCEMTSPDGAFYSAIDSESDAEEGKFYVWTYAEIIKVLGNKDGKLFAEIYGAKENGNFSEEATGHASKNNILHRTTALTDEVKKRLVPMRAKLLQTRSKREYPHLDDKTIAAWNGLMIEGLAYAGRMLDEPKYVHAAQRAADYLLNTMMKEGRLQRSSRNGQAKLDGYLNDYAFVAKSMVELYRATVHLGVAKEKYLDAATEMTETILSDFQDPVRGGFFFTAEPSQDNTSAEQLAGFVIRSKNLGSGGNLPSGNGVTTEVLLDLHELTGEARYRAIAAKTIESLSGHLHQSLGSPDHLLLALSRLEDSQSQGQFVGNVIQGTVLPAITTAAPSETVKIQVQLNIDAGWHLYGNASDEQQFVPTKLEVVPNPTVEVTEVRSPAATQKHDPVSDRMLSVYEGSVSFNIQLKVNASAASGPVQIEATLDYQACDDRKCLAPQHVTFQLPMIIKKAQ